MNFLILLTRRLGDRRSVDEDVRVVFEWLGKRAVRFLAIGGHGRVYKKN